MMSKKSITVALRILTSLRISQNFHSIRTDSGKNLENRAAIFQRLEATEQKTFVCVFCIFAIPLKSLTIE
jgi:hypothetical protein